MYIGKKNFWKTKKLKPLKGRKNKRHFKVETDWRTYTGSCDKLNEDIEKFGLENFERKILRCYTCKWDLNYAEAELQFHLGVLLDDYYYNGIIQVRLGKKK